MQPVKMTDEVLERLPAWSHVQVISIWSSYCHCYPIVSCFIKIQFVLTILVPAYPGCPGKEAAKRVSVCLSVCTALISRQPFVKRFALCYRDVVLSVCPVCLSVTLVYCVTKWFDGSK